MNKLREISIERLNEIANILDNTTKQIEEIPRIVLAAATIKGDGHGWIHNEVKATSIELFIMLVEFLKQNPGTVEVVEKAIEWVKLEGEYGPDFMNTVAADDNTKDLKDIINNMKKESPSANPDMLKSLEQEIKGSATGSSLDVDNLLDELLGKKDKEDDKEGDKQE